MLRLRLDYFLILTIDDILLTCIKRIESTSETFMDPEETLGQVKGKHKYSDVILVGDYYLPGIDWCTLTPVQGATDVNHCNKISYIAANNNLEQFVKEPTRKNNILDFCFTKLPGVVKRCNTAPSVSDHDKIVVVDTGIRANINKKKNTEADVQQGKLDRYRRGHKPLIKNIL